MSSDPFDLTTDPVARAFELARSGKHASIETIRRTLAQEGYTAVDLHLSGTLIRRQLIELMPKRTRPRRRDR